MKLELSMTVDATKSSCERDKNLRLENNKASNAKQTAE
jgi:hypothetical protein